MMDAKFDLRWKVVVIGDASVGKTCLLARFTQGSFKSDCTPTLAVEFLTKVIDGRDGQKVQLQLWDTAGQEIFKSVTTSYYRDAAAAVVVYDIGNKESFASVPGWVEQVRGTARPDVVLVLCGAKVDIRDAPPGSFEASVGGCVPIEEAKDYAEANKMICWETSAKTGVGVEEMFAALVKTLVERMGGAASGSRGGKGLDPPAAQPRKGGCC